MAPVWRDPRAFVLLLCLHALLHSPTQLLLPTAVTAIVVVVVVAGHLFLLLLVLVLLLLLLLLLGTLHFPELGAPVLEPYLYR